MVSLTEVLCMHWWSGFWSRFVFGKVSNIRITIEASACFNVNRFAHVGLPRRSPRRKSKERAARLETEANDIAEVVSIGAW